MAKIGILSAIEYDDSSSVRLYGPASSGHSPIRILFRCLNCGLVFSQPITEKGINDVICRNMDCNNWGRADVELVKFTKHSCTLTIDNHRETFEIVPNPLE